MKDCWGPDGWDCNFSVTEPVATVVDTSVGVTVGNAPTTFYSIRTRTLPSNTDATTILSPVSFLSSITPTTPSNPATTSMFPTSPQSSNKPAQQGSTSNPAVVPVTAMSSQTSPTTDPSTAGSSNPTSPPASTATPIPSSDSGLSTPAKVSAILIPILVLLAFLIAALLCWRRMRSRERQRADQLEAKATWFQPGAAEKIRQKMMEMDPNKVGASEGSKDDGVLSSTVDARHFAPVVAAAAGKNETNENEMKDGTNKIDSGQAKIFQTATGDHRPDDEIIPIK